MKLLPPFICLVVSFALLGCGGSETTTDATTLTPEAAKQLASKYSLPSDARILHIHDIEDLTGGQITVHFELPARDLQGFIAASPFKEAKLQSQYCDIRWINNTAWLSFEYCSQLTKKGTFLSGSISVGAMHYSILIDTSRPDTYVVFIQDSE